MENILNWVWLVLKHFIWISVSILYHLVATDDKKKIQCLNVVLNNKTEPLHVVLEFNWCRDTLYGDQSLPIIGHESVCKRQRKNIPPPPSPALSACFALVHQIIFLFFIYYPDDYEVDVCFPYHAEWSCNTTNNLPMALSQRDMAR